MSIRNITTIAVLLTVGSTLLSAQESGETKLVPREAARIDDLNQDGVGGAGDEKVPNILRVGDNKKKIEMRVVLQYSLKDLTTEKVENGIFIIQVPVKQKLGSPAPMQVAILEANQLPGIPFDNFHLDGSSPPVELAAGSSKSVLQADITNEVRQAFEAGASQLTVRLQAPTNGEMDEKSDHYWLNTDAEGPVILLQ